MTNEDYLELKERLLADCLVMKNDKAKCASKQRSYFKKANKYIKEQCLKGRKVYGWGIPNDGLRRAIFWAYGAYSVGSLPDSKQEEINDLFIELFEKILTARENYEIGS